MFGTNYKVMFRNWQGEADEICEQTYDEAVDTACAVTRDLHNRANVIMRNDPYSDGMLVGYAQNGEWYED